MRLLLSGLSNFGKTCFRWSCLRRQQSTNSNKQGYPLKILFFGSDAFSVGTLTGLVAKMRDCDSSKAAIKSIDVVTSESPQLVKGKKSLKAKEFVDYAVKNNLGIFKWNKDEISIKAKDYDFGVVASFGSLLPKNVITNFKRGIINAHPSLLPRWRGAAPIIHTILNGDTKTGVTIIDLSIGRFDRGKIFAQKEINIGNEMTAEELTQILAKLAGEMVFDVIENFDNYQNMTICQSDSGSTYAPKISNEISYINWRKDSCEYIDRLYRAIGQKIGVHAFWKTKLVKFVELRIHEEDATSILDDTVASQDAPGKVVFNKETRSLDIKCADGWMKISKLQVEYKKPITCADFYNAYMVDRKTNGILHDQFS